MIQTAQEFITLRTSQDVAEQKRATNEEAPLSVWQEIIATFPEYKIWIVRNKTVPVEILETLCEDKNEVIRAEIASKRKINDSIFSILSKDENENVRYALMLNKSLTKQQLQQIEIKDSAWLQEKYTEIMQDATQTYVILKHANDNGISLQLADTPIEESGEIIHTFEAENYNEAMTKRNELLGFEPYIPLPINIIAQRQLTLFDKNKKPLQTVSAFIYEPVKVTETEYHCEYHINIEHQSKTSNALKTEALGGKTIIGFDSLQAIQLALKMMDSIIVAYNQSNDNKIYWHEYGVDCGFAYSFN
jgi:hypothetical protein